MNNTNTSQCQQQELHQAIPVVLAALSGIGLVFNLTTLWIFWFSIKRWNSGILLQFNLAVVDSLVLPISPLMITYFCLGNHWPFGQFLCQLQLFLLGTHLYGSIYFLTLISIHRYQAIANYNTRLFWKQKAALKKLAWVVWTILFLQGSPAFVVLKTTVIDNSVKCLSIHQSELTSMYLIYNMVLTFACFVLPFGISLTSYLMLGLHICRIREANLRGRVIKVKSIQMIIVALVIFAICFVPLHVCQLVGTITKYYGMPCKLLRRVEAASFISLVFMMSHCCLDPFIYYLGNEKVASSLRRLLFSKRADPSWGRAGKTI